jgi:ABC-type protease/lipase transport system fused ATPase/permease subunit
MKEYMKNTIIIMISLRASALSFADKVLLLEEGELREDLPGEEGGNVNRI